MTATSLETLQQSSLITVERIDDLAGLDALREDWSDLLSASDGDCLFLSWEWLRTWWRHLAGERRLAMIAVRSRGLLIALAPLCARSVSILGRRPLPVLEFLGTGWVGSDYLDFIVRRGYEAEAQRAFESTLATGGQVIDFAQMRKMGNFAGKVAASLANCGWRMVETISNTCPFIPLSGATWESYLGSLGSEHRYNFNRKWKRLNKDHSVIFHRVDREEECREAVDLTIQLHRKRWSEHGKSDAFHTEALIEFHREFCLLALRRGWLRLYTLRVDEKPAACLYGFLYNRIFYFYQSGFDPAYQKMSVGLVSMGLGIQSAIEDGAIEYDLLHGNEDYKSHWSRESRELSRLQLYPGSFRGVLAQKTNQWERGARKLARRSLQRWLA